MGAALSRLFYFVVFCWVKGIGRQHWGPPWTTAVGVVKLYPAVHGRPENRSESRLCERNKNSQKRRRKGRRGGGGGGERGEKVKRSL